MSSTADLNGAFRGSFLLDSLDVYITLAAGERYLGKTTPEKSLSYLREYAEFSDGVPKSRYLIDFYNTGIEFKFTFKQIADLDAMSILTTGDLDTGGTVNDYLYYGNSPGELPIYRYRFAGKTRDDRLFEFVIRQGQIMNPGDISFGTQDYAGIEITVAALQDETISDKKRDLAYFRMTKRSFS